MWWRRWWWRRRLRRRFFTAAQQKLDEDALEGSIEDGVDDRVDGGRHVAQPQAQRYQTVGDAIAARRADGHQCVQQEERRPAQHEPAGTAKRNHYVLFLCVKFEI